jgi:5,10-methylenetetrahydromethanopterin reductase
MDELPHISLRLHGAMRPAEAIALAKVADEVGFAGIWFAENAFARGILPAAAVCAATTGRVQINAGVFNPFSRHPTMMAMEIGALDEIAKGRATLSIGAGIIDAVAKIGFAADKPLPALRDTLMIVRGLLRGEEVNHAGRVFSACKVKLDFAPRAGIPIFVAGRGDLTIKLAGEAADGLIISNMCSPDFARRAAELVHASHRAAGRADRVKVIQYMPCAIAEDHADAVNDAKWVIGKMLPGFWSLGQKLNSAKEGLIAGTGITEAGLANAVARLQAGEDAIDVLDERHVAAFSIAGTPEECLVAARRYRAAGVTELALTFDGPAADEDIRRLGRVLAASAPMT